MAAFVSSRNPRISYVQEKLTPFLRSCGYNPKKDITYVPISGLYGDNIQKPVDADKIWCGMCFLS